MELVEEPNNKHNNQIEFDGQGFDLFGILILNWLLTLVTLGLYYPWARVNLLRFYYGNTSLNNTSFVFEGNGLELFKGFIRVFALFVGLYVLFIYGNLTQNIPLMLSGAALLAICFIAAIPFALHGAMKYRLGRTSWRGIYFGYRGNRNELLYRTYTGLLLTIITLGIYFPWMVNDLRVYIISNMRFGNLRLRYHGKGSELFIIYLKAFFLMPITLGLYSFWFQKEYYNYLIEYTSIEQEGQSHLLGSEISGIELLELGFTNFFLVIITLGIGAPWAQIRRITYLINRIQIPETVNFDTVQQTEDEYKDATGEDLLDFLDIGIV
ncbi:MAG: YjgN family protein [Bacteroidia bacterium]|jgi:uncharacterized membrane protein YjgN (DUF898 family)|nr:YjgN family protein [Bacteroidia bacterium]